MRYQSLFDEKPGEFQAFEAEKMLNQAAEATTSTEAAWCASNAMQYLRSARFTPDDRDSILHAAERAFEQSVGCLPLPPEALQAAYDAIHDTVTLRTAFLDSRRPPLRLAPEDVQPHARVFQSQLDIIGHLGDIAARKVARERQGAVIIPFQPRADA